MVVRNATHSGMDGTTRRDVQMRPVGLVILGMGILLITIGVNGSYKSVIQAFLTVPTTAKATAAGKTVPTPANTAPKGGVAKTTPATPPLVSA